MLLIVLYSPNGLNFHNRNANGLRYVIALHNCLKGRTLILLCLVLSCLSGRAFARFYTVSCGYRLTYGYENYCLSGKEAIQIEKSKNTYNYLYINKL